MSKKAKKPAKKTMKTAAKKKPAKKKPARRAYADGSSVPAKRTTTATIFVYQADGGTRVRTSPQLLTCPPGDVEWTVVNLGPGEMPEVELSWPNGSPWGGGRIQIRGGNERRSLIGGQEGRFKYNVTCNGVTEDPELEWPEN